MENPFSSYRQFNHSFQEEFKTLSKEFPLAFELLECQLRLLRTNHLSPLKHNLLRYSQPGISKSIYYVFISFYLFVLKLIPYQIFHRPASYISLGRFRDLASLIQLELNEKNYKIICDINKKQLFQNFMSSRISFLPAVFCSFKMTRIFKTISKKGLEQSIEDRQLMDELEREALKLIERAKSLIYILNLQIIIADNEWKPDQKILLHAAKKVGCKYFVLAHGFVAQNELVTICPVNADALIVWTKDQQKFISSCLNKMESGKVKYFGWPFSIKRYETRNSIRPLFILTDLHSEMINPSMLDPTIQAFEILKKEYPKIILRPHPISFRLMKDQKFAEHKFTTFLKENLSYFSEHDSVENDFKRCKFVIGNGSSVLLEAEVNGIPAFQLAQAKNEYFFPIPEIKNEELHEFRKFQSAPSQSNDSLVDKNNIKRLIEFLTQA